MKVMAKKLWMFDEDELERALDSFEAEENKNVDPGGTLVRIQFIAKAIREFLNNDASLYRILEGDKSAIPERLSSSKSVVVEDVPLSCEPLINDPISEVQDAGLSSAEDVDVKIAAMKDAWENW